MGVQFSGVCTPGCSPPASDTWPSVFGQILRVWFSSFLLRLLSTSFLHHVSVFPPDKPFFFLLFLPVFFIFLNLINVAIVTISLLFILIVTPRYCPLNVSQFPRLCVCMYILCLSSKNDRSFSLSFSVSLSSFLCIFLSYSVGISFLSFTTCEVFL